MFPSSIVLRSMPRNTLATLVPTARRRFFSSSLATVIVATMSLVPAYGGDKHSGISIEFIECVESIGVTLLPTSQVEALVPSEFHVVGEGQPLTPIVVRSANCRISVDGYRARTGTVVQIGAVIVPPDFTGDINNYTLWYYTSDAKLAQQLKQLGIKAQHVPTIEFGQIPSGNDGLDSFHVAVPRPGRPALSLDGEVVPSGMPAGTFTANWWVATDRGTVKMQTFVPEILIGGADIVLTAEANSPLSDLIGGQTLSFPILQQFNVFETALMDVSILAP